RRPVTEPLPEFRYQPDPVATGAFERVRQTCAVCERERGWIYVFGTYGDADLRDSVCPWCIADGSAADDFGVVFTDLGRATEPLPADIPEPVVDEVQHRTPGFSAWQEEQWLFHCGDAAAFLGP